MTKGFMFTESDLCLLVEFSMQMQEAPIGHEEILELFNALLRRMNIFMALNGCGYFDTVEFFVREEKLLEGGYLYV